MSDAESPAARPSFFLVAGVLLLMTAFICIPYFGIQRYTSRPPIVLEPSWLDHRVPFQPSWTPVYLSLVLIVPLAASLARTRAQVWRFLLGIVALGVPSFLVFWGWPVAGPRPEALAPGSYAWLVSIDTPVNSFPSLHAALTLYCLGFAWWVRGRSLEGARRRSFAGLALAWGLLVIYATLATKQHYVVDLLGGGALGALGLWLARRAPSAATDSGA